MDWRFYGRTRELAQIGRLLDRPRWFFCAITGRRRIGKTHLIQEALRRRPQSKSLYVQIPDSEEMRVVRAFRDAIEDCGVSEMLGTKTSRDNIIDFTSMARAIADLCRSGAVVVLDEFQYFHRKALAPFLSFLQAEVDALRSTKKGGLIILGSVHTEMIALIEDKASPLFGRITDELKVNHWDFRTIFEVFGSHSVSDPYHWLLVWGILEGVPKFYRDAHEAGTLRQSENFRKDLLEGLFFAGTSPLKDEAEHWFLRELRGRYDTVLDILARRQPCGHGDLTAEFRQFGEEKALSGYIQQLSERLSIVTRLEPIFAPNSHRKSRYIIADNFLSAWLSALDRAVKMARIRPLDQAVNRASALLEIREGHSLEKMIRCLLEEQSQLNIGDFGLSDQVKGYWDRPDTGSSSIEIDSIAYSDEDHIVRLGSCKRAATAHDASSLYDFEDHVSRFLETKAGKRFKGYRLERALYSPKFTRKQRLAHKERGYRCFDLQDFADRFSALDVRAHGAQHRLL